MLKKITYCLILLLVCGTVSAGDESYFIPTSVLPYIGDDLKRIEGAEKEDVDIVADVLCSYSSRKKYDELKQKASENQYDLSMAFVLTSTKCMLNSDSGRVPYGPVLHKAVNNGLHTLNMTTGVLRYLKNKPADERLVLFEAILDGSPSHRNLLEEFLVSYERTGGRKETLVRSARMVCKAIEVFELERELGHYLYDTASGCRHPFIGFEPAKP